MPFTTPSPVELKRANRWTIGHISIDPDQPSITWMTRISMDATEVDRVTLSLAGRDIRDVEDLAPTLRKLRGILNRYAIEKGIIPQVATEEPDPPEAPEPATVPTPALETQPPPEPPTPIEPLTV